MFSEIATEGTVQVIVGEIKKELEANKDKPDAVIALKKLGRFALTQFEWSTPDWAKEYYQLFGQTPSEKVEDLKRLLLQAQPVMVFGTDFTAFNYGDSEFAGGRDSLVTSAFGHARINRQTGVWSFNPEPNVPIREASHFKADRKHVDLTFQQVRAEVEK